MEFRILGPLEVSADGRLLTPSAPRQRALLAMLLLRANRVISTDQLIDQLWGEAPPTTARVTLQTYVLRLRRLLHAPGDARRHAVLVTRPPGYLLRVQPGELDLHHFDRLVDEAGTAMAEHAPERAAEKLRAALALWRGPALADVASEFLRRIEATRLEERHWSALEERIEADLAVGRHTQLVGELDALVAEQPLRERLRGQLMLALYRSGRQAEALGIFRDAREVLAKELGLEPGPSLQRLERAILAADPSLELAPRSVTVAGTPTPATVPCDLPPDIRDFTGREDALAAVHGLLERGEGESATALVVLTVGGKAGVGKTALVVRAAHQLRSRFPDGQLFVNLRGTEGHATEPASVLAEFLRALGVDGTAIPEGMDERARLFRSRLSDKRMLVVLDNAASEAQVRCLLPGAPGCAVLVTSRARLIGVEAAESIELDVLELDEAVELLGRVAGPERVVAEPEAARAIALLCGRLPLAVRVAGAKLAAKRHWSLATLCERLADQRRRLDELSAGDLEVRASIAFSYQGQRDDQRRAFRLLGLVDIQDFAAWVAAALLGSTPAVAEDLVEQLVDIHLLEVAGKDAWGATRYRFHDLLRVFARERLEEEEPALARRAALGRALGAYLTLAERADVALQPGALRRIGPGTARRWEPEGLDIVKRIERDPLTWFAAERANLVAVVEQTYATGSWELTWRLAHALATFFEVRAVWDDWRRTHELALRATRRAGDRCGQAYILHRLGGLYVEQGRFKKAIACYDRCLSIHRELGDRLGEADTMHDLGVVHWDQDRFDEAMALFNRCLPIYRALGDRRLEADTLRVIGAVHRDQGRFGEAQACFDQCLPVFRQLGDRLGEAYALRNLGSVYRAEDRFDEARSCLDHSLASFRELNDPLGEATSLLSLGEVYRDQGQLGEAIDRFDQCLPVFRRFGFRLWEGRTLSNLGDSLAEVGNQRAASLAWRDGLAILQEIGAPEAAQVRARLGADVSQ